MLEKLFKMNEKRQLMKENKRLKVEAEKLEAELRKKGAVINCKNLSQIKNKAELVQEVDLKENEDWREIEQEVKRYSSENMELKKELMDREKIHGLRNLEYNYLIDLEKYFKEVKFKNIVEYLLQHEKRYVQDLTSNEIEILDCDEKLKGEFLEKYLKFNELKVAWDLKLNILKGDKITKLYQKYRKLINILLSENIEYVDELEKYDFESLSGKGYETSDIQEFKRIYEDYIRKYRIERRKLC